MTEFWITFAVFGVVFLPLIIVTVTGCNEWGMKIGLTICLLALWSGLAFGIWAEADRNEQAWNGGCCPNCGTHWELAAVSESRYGHETKYYVCPDCHKEITIENS